jgi:hypothetical protein
MLPVQCIGTDHHNTIKLVGDCSSLFFCRDQGRRQDQVGLSVNIPALPPNAPA